MIDVLEGRIPDRVPIVCRLEFWHRAHTSAGTLPAEVAGLTVEDTEHYLGMGRSARLRGVVKEHREGVTETIEQDGDREIRTLDCEGRRLIAVEQCLASHRASGMRGQTLRHFLNTPDDYRTMIEIWRRTTISIDHHACARLEREVGDDGIGMLMLPPIPAHRIMLLDAGYEQFYFHTADMPDLVDELQQVMEQRYEAFWADAARCIAPLVLHGANWNAQMTPPPVFEQRFLPYLRRFAAAMHDAGKRCAFHSDGDMSGLLDLALQSDYDVADCVACAPLVPLSLEQIRRAWGDRIVVWGGFPATVLDDGFSDAEFEQFLDSFANQISDGHRMIVGVSDAVMPTALWPRIKALAHRVNLVRPVTT